MEYRFDGLTVAPDGADINVRMNQALTDWARAGWELHTASGPFKITVGPENEPMLWFFLYWQRPQGPDPSRP